MTGFILITMLDWPDDLDWVNSIYVCFSPPLFIWIVSFFVSIIPVLLKLASFPNSLSFVGFILGGSLAGWFWEFVGTQLPQPLQTLLRTSWTTNENVLSSEFQPLPSHWPTVLSSKRLLAIFGSSCSDSSDIPFAFFSFLLHGLINGSCGSWWFTPIHLNFQVPEGILI